VSNAWDADRELSVEMATAVIRESLPSLDVRDLTLIGSGWEFDAYLTRDGWVVRFPRRAEMSELFEAERGVHRLVSRFLPTTTGIPHVELSGRPAAGFPYEIAAHRYIPGIPIDEVDGRFASIMAREIGTTLGAVHSIPEQAAHDAAVAAQGETPDGSGDWFKHGLSVVTRRNDRDPIIDRAVAWASEASVLNVEFSGPLRFIHQDLSPEHVLADPQTGHITGILDWTDAMLGDAARDFVFLVGWRGWPYVEEVLLHYPPVDEGFRDRLRFMSRLLTPVWLGYAYERGTEIEKMRTWVRHAYA
jgi:aminoglycoside phosphotransferase (APT) family kinase protein